MSVVSSRPSPLVILGVTGSIAAYKSPEILRLLRAAGADVRVAMTNAATKFVGPLTFEALSDGIPVYRDQVEIGSGPSGISHTDLTAKASAFVVAPASADIIAKIAHGFGDDPVAATALALPSTAKLVIAPAMNPRMWENAAVQENVERLKKRGVIVVGPGRGDTACGDLGTGRMSEPAEIVAATMRALGSEKKKILILNGPTREHIDDVRFISNGSSGKMGAALAEAAFAAGSDVTVITGPAHVLPAPWIKTIHVTSASEMFEAARKQNFDFLFAPAAIADYSPVKRESGKPKKSGKLSVEMAATIDVVASLRKNSPATFTAFAAEENEDIPKAIEKGKRKGANFIVLNKATPTMGSDEITAHFIDVASGRSTLIGPASKRTAAEEIFHRAVNSEKL